MRDDPAETSRKTSDCGANTECTKHQIKVKKHRRSLMDSCWCSCLASTCIHMENGSNRCLQQIQSTSESLNLRGRLKLQFWKIWPLGWCKMVEQNLVRKRRRESFQFCWKLCRCRTR